METAGTGRRLLSIPWLLSLAVGIAFPYFLVAKFEVDLNLTWLRIRSSNLFLYLLAFLAHYASFLVRGLRWRIIASSADIQEGDEKRLPSTWTCTLFVFLGWFGNSFGWFRMGDAYRAYALARASGGSFPRSLGTVVAERVVDVAAIFFLFLVALGGVGLAQEKGPSSLFLLASIGLLVAGVGVVLAMAVLGPRLMHFLPVRFRPLYEHFHHGTLRGFRRLPVVLFLSLAAWLLEASRLYLVIQALGLSLGLPLTLFVALVNATLTAIPFTPGGLGIVEPGIVGALLLGMPRYVAISTAVLDRSISYVSVIVLGAVAFLVYQVILGARHRKEASALVAGSSPPRLPQQ